MLKTTALPSKLKSIFAFAGNTQILALFSVILACSYFFLGLQNNLHHWISEGIEYENVKLAAAITQGQHGYDTGFAASTIVHEKLRSEGVTIYRDKLEPLGLTYPDNMHDPDVINNAFAEAANIPVLDEPKLIIKELKPVEPNDLGLAVYYELAFDLFGLKVESFFYLYCLLHLVAVLLFIFAYRHRREAMALLLLITTLHLVSQGFLVGGMDAAAQFGVSSSYNQRYISVLGIVSALHLLLFVLWPPPFLKRFIIPIVIQASIVFLVFICRRSAIWEIAWIISPAIIALFVLVLWRILGMERWPQLFRPILFRSLSWPFGFILVCFFTLNSVYNGQVNPVYKFGDEFMSQHMVWHSVFVGLSAHPEWQSRFGDNYLDENGNAQTGDGLPIRAAVNYIRDNYGIEKSYLLSPLWGWKYKTTERVIKEAYFEFVRENPMFVLEATLIHKPKTFFSNYIKYVSGTLSGLKSWAIVLAIVTLITAITALTMVGTHSFAVLAQLTAIFWVGALGATVPAVLIFPSHPTMGDQVFMVNASLFLTFSLILGSIIRHRKLST